MWYEESQQENYKLVITLLNSQFMDLALNSSVQIRAWNSMYKCFWECGERNAVMLEVQPQPTSSQVAPCKEDIMCGVSARDVRVT